MFGKLLSWIDGPIVSRIVAAIVAGVMGIVAAHVVLTPDQSAQFQQAITSIVTLIIYAITHNGIKTLSVDSGNKIVPPAGSAK